MGTAMVMDMEDTDTVTTATTVRGPLMLSPDTATTDTGTAMDTATDTDMEDTATTDTTARGPLMPSPGMVTTDMGTVMDTAMGTATATATDTTDEAAQEVHVFQSD